MTDPRVVPDRRARDRWCRVCKTITNHVTEECSGYDPRNPAHEIPGCLRDSPASDETMARIEPNDD